MQNSHVEASRNSKNLTRLVGFFPECKMYTLNKFDRLNYCAKNLKKQRKEKFRQCEIKKPENMSSTADRQSLIINLPT